MCYILVHSFLLQYRCQLKTEIVRPAIRSRPDFKLTLAERICNTDRNGREFMEINETRIRYLEAIQRVIDRLSNISFILKGWAVSLVAALMALAASGSNQGFVLIAYIPIAVFWFLDAYFLMMERQYRDLFKENMDLSKSLKYFSLVRPKGNVIIYGKALFSITIFFTYATLIGATLIVFMLIGG